MFCVIPEIRPERIIWDPGLDSKFFRLDSGLRRNDKCKVVKMQNKTARQKFWERFGLKNCPQSNLKPHFLRRALHWLSEV